MKLHKNALLLIILLAFLSPLASAQDVTTQGTEFWLSFISNGFKYHPDAPLEGWLRVQLLVSAKRDCEGTITNPNTGWSRNFTVEADHIFSIDLVETQVYIESDEYERVVNKGLQITTTDTVSVYCANIAIYSFDASFVLPIQGLADDYIIQTYNQSTTSYDPSSAFVIVATEDNTTIDITPSIRTLGGRPANEEFSITLNKGEAYQVRSRLSNYPSDNCDLSGTRVTARDCKKIAIFNGNNLTMVPKSASSDADCIFEQAMPLRSWGKKFIITSSLNRNIDYYRITSSADDNIIYRNGEILGTLNANETLEYQITSSEKSCYIETTHSCAVYLYNNSSNGAGNGAPSMVWVAPIEQRIDEITFSTFNYDHDNVNITNHYVNIIVETQDVEHVYLDNQLLPSSQFQTVTGNENYSFCQKQISHGVHQLSCPNGFNAHVYGFGRARGYAYMVGSKATDLSTTILINNEVVMPNDTISNCSLDPITFKADINLNDYNLVWDFGDGTTSTENPVVHTYPANELYQAQLTVTTQATPCGGSSSSNSSSVLIDARTEPDTNVSDEICAGDFYTGYGFNNILIRHDTILTREQPGTLNPDCITHINVSITCYPTEPLTLTDQVCFNGPSTYTENGFNIHYDRPDTTYTVTQMMPNEFGCDRSVTMVLHISRLTDHEPDIKTDCNYYTWPWNGETYYENVSIDDTIADPETGCYEIGHLRLNLNYTPTPRLTASPTPTMTSITTATP